MTNEIIKLIKIKKGETNDVGDVVTTRTEREVFCSVKSVGRSEFYSGMAKGFKPELVFILEDYEDYQDEEMVQYNNIEYKILKTYRKEQQLELTCYGGIFNNVTT